MSVPEHRRTESSVQFLATFHKLRKCTNTLLMEDFGVKIRTYEISDLVKKQYMSKEDAAICDSIFKKYSISGLDLKDAPEWIVLSWRQEVRYILTHIGIEIELANSIYVQSEEELIERTSHWNSAIGYCHALNDKLQEIMDAVDVMLGRYEEVSNLLQQEIGLLKGVRRSDRQSFNKNKQGTS